MRDELEVRMKQVERGTQRAEQRTVPVRVGERYFVDRYARRRSRGREELPVYCGRRSVLCIQCPTCA